MRKPKNATMHKAAPNDWKNIPDLSGSFELDASICKCTNKEAAMKLSDHLIGNDAYIMQNRGYGKN